MKVYAQLLPALASKIYRLRWFLLLLFMTALFFIWLMSLKGVTVTVTNQTRWLDKVQLKQNILQRMDNRWLTLSIQDIKYAAERIDWVDKVEVKRVWPSRLELKINEQKPLACWNGMALTNREKLIAMKKCPGQWVKVDAQKQFIARFVALQDKLQQLAQQFNLLVRQVNINDRGTWVLTTNKKLQLIARDRDIQQSLQLWLDVLKQKPFPDLEQIKKIDLRYPNGFAVQPRPLEG